MATLQGALIETERPIYTDNIVSVASTYNLAQSFSITAGTGTVAISSDISYYNQNCLKVNWVDMLNPLAFHSANDTLTVTQDGVYVFSHRIFCVSTNPVMPPGILYKIKLFKNAVAFHEIECSASSDIFLGYDDNVWNCFAQSFTLSASDVLSWKYEVTNGQTLLGDVTFYIGGIKVEYDDREVFTPSIYTPPIALNPNGYITDIGTGWEACVDTLHTSGSPQSVLEGVTDLLSNNKGTIFNDQLPIGVSTFFDVATTKITPDQENDYMVTSLMFKAKNSLANGYFTVFVDIPTLGERFTETHLCPKDANTETGFDITIGHFVSEQFFTNGGIIKVKADKGNLSIYDKQFRFSRVHKAI